MCLDCIDCTTNSAYLFAENMNSSVPIPTEIAKLPELHEIRLPLNKFSGTIPRELQELTGLVVLDLGHNGLQGEIPTGILVLPHLEALNLNHNRLFGHFSLPLTLQSKLTGLNLWNNLVSWIDRWHVIFCISDCALDSTTKQILCSLLGRFQQRSVT